MWTTIAGSVLTSLLPVALKLVLMWVDKKISDPKKKKRMYDLIEEWYSEANIPLPAKLRSDWDKQTAMHDAREAAEDAEKEKQK